MIPSYLNGGQYSSVCKMWIMTKWNNKWIHLLLFSIGQITSINALNTLKSIRLIIITLIKFWIEKIGSSGCPKEELLSFILLSVGLIMYKLLFLNPKISNGSIFLVIISCSGVFCVKWRKDLYFNIQIF